MGATKVDLSAIRTDATGYAAAFRTLIGVGGGGGDMILASAQDVTGAKTFRDTKFFLRNVANTFNGSFLNTNTADRIYTLKDASGTLAFTSDVAVGSLAGLGTGWAAALAATYSAGGGGGDMLLGTAQTVTAAKTFLDTTLLLRNVANTFNGSFSNANTANRVYSLPDITDTLVTLTAAQTLSSKTLASPTITGVAAFGGVTSSFPALKNSGAVLQARLADDSGFANFSAKQGVFSQNITATYGPSGEMPCILTGDASMLRLIRTGLVDIGIGELSGTSFCIRNNGDASSMLAIHATTKTITTFGGSWSSYKPYLCAVNASGYPEVELLQGLAASYGGVLKLDDGLSATPSGFLRLRYDGGYPKIESTATLTISSSTQVITMGTSSTIVTVNARNALTLNTNSIASSLVIKAGTGHTYHTSFTNSADAIVASISPTGAVVAASFNAVVLTAAGSSSLYLNEAGIYTSPGGGGGYTNLTQFLTQTADVVFYADAAGDVKELALGASGTYLKSNGAGVAPSFAAPPGSGDMLLGTAQTVTAAKTFLDTTFLLRNVANTFNGSFVNTNTANRVYTLKDATGTLAFTSDITGTVTATGGALTSNLIVLGAGTTDTKVTAGIASDGVSSLLLGVAAVSVGAFVLRNMTSGSITFQPVTGALGSAVLLAPAVSDTLTCNAATQALTNKSVNGVTLTAAGSASLFLNEAGGYTAPAGGGGSNNYLAVALGGP